MLRTIVGVVIVFFALALLLGLNLTIKNEKLALLPVGVTSGLLASGIAMAGPPVILFFSNQGMQKQVFRANLAAYFVFLNTITIPAHAASGLFTGEVVRFALLFLPTLVAGMVFGSFLSRKVPEAQFHRVVLVVVLCSGPALAHVRPGPLLAETGRAERFHHCLPPPRIAGMTHVRLEAKL